MADADETQAEHDQVPVWIESIQFADGNTVDLQPGHVVVLVGPNNVGKSQTLRNIDQAITNRNHPGYKVAKRVSLSFQAERKGSIRQWVEDHVPRFTASSGTTFFSRGGASVQEAQFDQQLDRVRPSRLDIFGTMMTLFANAEERLQLSKKAKPIDVEETAPTSPVQALYGRSHEIEAVSDACLAAFGKQITYDHLVDGMWRLRLGEVPNLEVDRHGFPTADYRDLMRGLPAVDEQGDGLRSYVGLLAEFLSSTHLFVLLDEPEAFLHPPQARLLGRHIVEFKSDASQLVVATHDANFLRGILDATPTTPVSIVRLQRIGSTTTARVLEPGALRDLWEDPVLRYSNILEGLFHHGVIVCEAEPDCRLYESLIQAHDLADSGTDFMFAQSGGVERVHAVVEALKAIGVPTQAILDADTAAKPDVLVRIMHSLGEEWTEEMDALQKRIASVAQDKAVRPMANRVRLAFEDALQGKDHDDELDAGTLATLTDALRPKSGWEDYKKYGLKALRGEQHTWGKQLFDDLAERGIHLVPTGELESWFPDAPGKGAKHVRYVQENRWHEDADRSSAIVGFLRAIVGSLPNRMQESA